MAIPMYGEVPCRSNVDLLAVSILFINVFLSAMDMLINSNGTDTTLFFALSSNLRTLYTAR